MATYGQYYANAPYGSPAWHEQQARLRNAHKSPDPILAMKQSMTTNTVPGGSNVPPALMSGTGNGNPLPTTAIPPGTQVNPRQGPAPGQRFVNGAKGILGQMTSGGEGPSQYISEQYGQQSPVEAATQEFNMTSPENLQHRGPERYVPAPVVDSVGQGPMTEEERAAFAQTPAGRRIQAAQSMDPELKQPNQTDKKRDKTSFGDYLKKKVYEDDPRGGNSLSSKLIRMGAAMQGSSHQGLNAAMAAMGGEYGNIQREDQAAEQAFMAQQAKQQEANAKAIAEQQEGLNEMNQLDSRFSQALAKFELYDNVTGITPVDGFSRVTDWAGMNDSSRQAFRLELKQIIVDETLLSTAKTKGAVSDKEMALFASGIPTMNDDEETWKAWLNQRRSWIAHINNRISAGTRVSSDAEVGFPGYSAPETSQKQYSAEEDDALFNF